MHSSDCQRKLVHSFGETWFGEWARREKVTDSSDAVELKECETSSRLHVLKLLSVQPSVLEVLY